MPGLERGIFKYVLKKMNLLVVESIEKWNLYLFSSVIIDIETNCLEEKSKRDYFTQLVLACLVSF